MKKKASLSALTILLALAFGVSAEARWRSRKSQVPSRATVKKWHKTLTSFPRLGSFDLEKGGTVTLLRHSNQLLHITMKRGTKGESLTIARLFNSNGKKTKTVITNARTGTTKISDRLFQTWVKRVPRPDGRYKETITTQFRDSKGRFQKARKTTRILEGGMEAIVKAMDRNINILGEHPEISIRSLAR